MSNVVRAVIFHVPQIPAPDAGFVTAQTARAVRIVRAEADRMAQAQGEVQQGEDEKGEGHL
jgi:hypothetical protein